MRYSLYSELRTLYEATAENPRTFRATIKMKDMIDEAVLVNAVRKSMERYPYYRVRVGIDERGRRSVYPSVNAPSSPVCA